MNQGFSFKIFSFVLFCLCLNVTTQAQTIKRANSPYSYFGIGDIESTAFGMNKALGGLSLSLRSAVNINLDNPASLSAIQRTTFETAFDINLIGLNNGLETQSMSDMGIAYLALAVPVTKFWGSSIGILPYSSVYYDITESKTVENLGTQQFEYIGAGSLYQVYWGNGFNYKAFSAGVQVAYVFGNIERSTLSLYPDQTNIMPYLLGNTSQIGGFTWNTGIQFHPKLNDRMQLTVGLTLASATTLNEDVFTELRRLGISINGQVVSDTAAIVSSETLDKPIDLPSKFGFGATINKGAYWLAGFDIEMANWSNTNLSDVNAEYTNTFKVKAGAAFVPYREGIRNFINQTQFRIGAYYNNNYFNVRVAETNDFQALNQFGFTFGAGFPLSKKAPSRFNLAFDIGQRGSIENNVTRETYFKVNIGVTLNDLWFVKPKYD